MPPRGPQIPLLKRAAILALHWHAKKSWIEISTLLLVHPETARKICLRAKERATDPTDFDDVLQHLEDAERPGRRRKGSKKKKIRMANTIDTKIKIKDGNDLQSDNSGEFLGGRVGEGDGEFEWIE